ncbi:nuclear transport factor 2 family protein [Nocardia bovistercoris]|uniref:Nuclear transport factor 2 family protein n=1 Tax=Nocardia bovistercoris TaxID=2785916 RepID=A0A931N3B5_9NOCA|nr:nuclear transport factor 2 family protein [Nocardia bovistercoris]MBH0776961.1 nuclear transport factor 2 family protein [Nocardia bovistercoris]
MTEQQIDERETWETYAASWKAASETEKKALFAESLALDCVYTDPIARTEGWDELTAYMVDFHRQVPGGHFVTRSFQVHHGVCLAQWDMVAGDGTVLGDGISYGQFGDDGRLIAMTGFFDTPDQ